MFDLNFKFVTNGKFICLHRVIKYLERSKNSVDDFSAKHTPCEPLKKDCDVEHNIDQKHQHSLKRGKLQFYNFLTK